MGTKAVPAPSSPAQSGSSQSTSSQPAPSQPAPAQPKPPTAPSINWTIPIHLIDNLHATPEYTPPWNPAIKIGDCVRFTSGDGVPRVVWEGENPFSEEPGYIIPNSGYHKVVKILTADNPGQAYCWIQLPGQETYIGYGPKSDAAHSGVKVPPGSKKPGP
jgi:hypothetical protein